MASNLLLPRPEERKQQEADREKVKRERIELTLKILSALGVVAGIVYGGVKLFPPHTPPEQTYETYDIPAQVRGSRAPFTSVADVKLRQFELFGIESAFVKNLEGAIGTQGNTVPSYSLDPYYSTTFTPSSVPTSRVPSPIFMVTLENPRDTELLVTRILYRVKKVGEVKGGNYGPLSPNAKYRTSIAWKVSDQVADLTPPFRIAAKSTGSFLLEVTSRQPGVGLTWLLEVIFVVDSGFGGVTTGEFEIILNKRR